MLFLVSAAQIKRRANTGFKCGTAAVGKTKSQWQPYNYIVQERFKKKGHELVLKQLGQNT